MSGSLVESVRSAAALQDASSGDAGFSEGAAVVGPAVWATAVLIDAKSKSARTVVCFMFALSTYGARPMCRGRGKSAPSKSSQRLGWHRLGTPGFDGFEQCVQLLFFRAVRIAFDQLRK